MNKIITAATVLLLMSACTAHGQGRPNVMEPPKLWVHASAVMYTTLTDFADPGTSSRWLFDNPSFGAGAGIQQQFGSSLIFGLDATYVRTKYQRTELTGAPIAGAEGNAGIATGMVTGRLAYGGGSDVGIYFGGGLGTMAYNLEDVGSWNADFAMRAGSGIEYKLAPNKAIALEWLRMWAYHEDDDLGGDTQRPSMLRFNFRLGL